MASAGDAQAQTAPAQPWQDDKHTTDDTTLHDNEGGGEDAAAASARKNKNKARKKRAKRAAKAQAGTATDDAGAHVDEAQQGPDDGAKDDAGRPHASKASLAEGQDEDTKPTATFDPARLAALTKNKAARVIGKRRVGAARTRPRDEDEEGTADVVAVPLSPRQPAGMRQDRHQPHMPTVQLSADERKRLRRQNATMGADLAHVDSVPSESSSRGLMGGAHLAESRPHPHAHIYTRGGDVHAQHPGFSVYHLTNRRDPAASSSIAEPEHSSDSSEQAQPLSTQPYRRLQKAQDALSLAALAHGFSRRSGEELDLMRHLGLAEHEGSAAAGSEHRHLGVDSQSREGGGVHQPSSSAEQPQDVRRREQDLQDVLTQLQGMRASMARNYLDDRFQELSDAGGSNVPRPDQARHSGDWYDAADDEDFEDDDYDEDAGLLSLRASERSAHQGATGTSEEHASQPGASGSRHPGRDEARQRRSRGRSPTVRSRRNKQNEQPGEDSARRGQQMPGNQTASKATTSGGWIPGFLQGLRSDPHPDRQELMEQHLNPRSGSSATPTGGKDRSGTSSEAAFEAPVASVPGTSRSDHGWSKHGFVPASHLERARHDLHQGASGGPSPVQEPAAFQATRLPYEELSFEALDARYKLMSEVVQHIEETEGNYSRNLPVNELPQAIHQMPLRPGSAPPYLTFKPSDRAGTHEEDVEQAEDEWAGLESRSMSFAQAVRDDEELSCPGGAIGAHRARLARWYFERLNSGSMLSHGPHLDTAQGERACPVDAQGAPPFALAQPQAEGIQQGHLPSAATQHGLHHPHVLPECYSYPGEPFIVLNTAQLRLCDPDDIERAAAQQRLLSLGIRARRAQAGTHQQVDDGFGQRVPANQLHPDELLVWWYTPDELARMYERGACFKEQPPRVLEAHGEQAAQMGHEGGVHAACPFSAHGMVAAADEETRAEAERFVRLRLEDMRRIHAEAALNAGHGRQDQAGGSSTLPGGRREASHARTAADEHYEPLPPRCLICGGRHPHDRAKCIATTHTGSAHPTAVRLEWTPPSVAHHPGTKPDATKWDTHIVFRDSGRRVCERFNGPAPGCVASRRLRRSQHKKVGAGAPPAAAAAAAIATTATATAEDPNALCSYGGVHRCSGCGQGGHGMQECNVVLT